MSDFIIGNLCLEQLVELLAIAKIAAARAAELINECITMHGKGAHGSVQITTKTGSADLVTQYDKRCEETIKATLEEECSRWVKSSSRNSNVKFDFLGEESDTGKGLSDMPTWVVDPIDGTTSFIHGSFDCGVSIGLCVFRQPVVGVVHLPRMNEVFTAVIGRGAFRNEDRIYISECTQMSKALVCTHISYNRSKAAVDALMSITRDLLLKHKVHSIRNYGSAAMDMCSVGCGRMDMYFEAGIHSWDMCGATIIVREAGGICVGLDVSDEGLDALDEYFKIQKTENKTPKDIERKLQLEKLHFDVTNDSMVVATCPALIKTAVHLSREYNYYKSVLYIKDGSKV